MDIKEYEEGRRRESFWDIADNELKEILLSQVKSSSNKKILNIGCGTAEDTRILQQFGETYISDIDITPLKIRENENYKRKLVATAEKLPFKGNTFEIICMFGSIEHIKEDKTAIQEAERVLKENGYLLLTGPAYQSLYSNHDIALKHFRRYNKSQINSIISNNLKEVRLSYWNSILFLPIAVMKLLNKGKNKKQKLHPVIMNKWIDRVLLSILRIENSIAKQNIAVPVGANFYGIYQKK